MRASLLGCRRHFLLGCTLPRLFFFAVILIAVQVTIVVYQVMIWAKIHCANPMKCSSVVFFENLERENKKNLFSVPRIETTLQKHTQDSVIATQSSEKNRGEFHGCGINGRYSDEGANGSVNLHIWYGWCGFTTDDLRRDPNFPATPKIKTTVSELRVKRTVYKRYSGKRMFGYIHPPTTGVYQFFISSEDSSDLWLSTDDNPHNTRMIAYIGEASNQYGGSVQPGDYSQKSQQSKTISLIEGNPYFIEMYQKKKNHNDHMQVAWRIPGNNDVEVISSRYLSQYINTKLNSKKRIAKREECVMKGVPGLSLRYLKFIQVQQPEFRDAYFIEAKMLKDSDVDDVLRVCPYKPKYLSRPIKKQFDSQLIIVHSLVYPNDSTALYKQDIETERSEGNSIIPEKEAKSIVTNYMNALKAQKGDKFQLNRIVQIEAKYDSDGGVRYFMELDMKDKQKDHNVRLSRYLYSPSRTNTTSLCYPEGYKWKKDIPIYMIVTVMNYGYWIKDLIKQLAKFYRKGIDRNFYLTIIDFNSTDINLKETMDKSDLKDRYFIVKKSAPFWKTRGLNEGAALVKDPHSIIFTMDLHLKLPANIFDAIRKHTIEGKIVFTPKLLKLKCGFSPSYAQGGWDTFGYGLFATYKSDWERIGGMDEEQFRHKWGGEDVDLMDRVLKAKLDVDRICLPKLYHLFHPRDQDWYEDARM